VSKLLNAFSFLFPVPVNRARLEVVNLDHLEAGDLTSCISFLNRYTRQVKSSMWVAQIGVLNAKGFIFFFIL